MDGKLERLLIIRGIRESNTGARLKECQARYARSLERQRRRASHRDNYRNWRIKQESKLFEKLQNQPVTVNTLDQYRAKIAALKQREEVLDTRARKSSESASTALKNLDSARKAYNLAMRAKEKLEEYSTIRHCSASRDRIHKEELEIDELVVVTAQPIGQR